MAAPKDFSKRGGSHELFPNRKAEIIYDLTFSFGERFLNRGYRTINRRCRLPLSINSVVINWTILI